LRITTFYTRKGAGSFIPGKARFTMEGEGKSFVPRKAFHGKKRGVARNKAFERRGEG